METSTQYWARIQAEENARKEREKLTREMKVHPVRPQYRVGATTHGMSDTLEYSLWCVMRRRCVVPTEHGYERFGALGIRVCAEWDASFEAFMRDMGPRPADMNSVERIDTFGNYEPSNCRWGTSKRIEFTDKDTLTAEQVRQRYSYDPATGDLTRIMPAKGAMVGRVTGSLDGNGYTVLRIGNKGYRAHRLAWLYVYGEWPKGQIDHINGDRTDNRIANLRDVDQRVNSQNAWTGPKGASGYMGVTWHKVTGKWAAQIQADKQKRHLGLFDTAEEAHAAYVAAKNDLHAGSTILNRVKRVGLVQVVDCDPASNDEPEPLGAMSPAMRAEYEAGQEAARSVRRSRVRAADLNQAAQEEQS